MSDYVQRGVTDALLVKFLEALRKTVPIDQQPDFWRAVRHFADLETFHKKLTLLSWAVYFPPSDEDRTSVAARVYCVMSGLVPYGSFTPPCPLCSGDTKFGEDGQSVFGWAYRCAAPRVSRSEARRRHLNNKRACSGRVSAMKNTWMEGSKNINKTLGLLFCWLNKISVTAAAAATECGPNTAVDHYSMAREVCEVVMTNEVTSRRFGGPGIQVEVDECFLTRRKFHKGRRMQTGTVTLFGIYERGTNLGFHLQVRDRSQAVLISEIQKFIEPGSHIISDGMASYRRLPEYGYVHDVVIHDKEFVNSEDTAVHTQNIEIRNRWTKAAIRSFKSNRPLHSYCSEYTYRSVINSVYFSVVSPGVYCSLSLTMT